MDPRRRVLLRDFGLAIWVLVLYATSSVQPWERSETMLAAVVGGVAFACFAYVSEHTDRFDGLVDDLGPHVVAVLLLATALGTTTAVLATVVPIAASVAFLFGGAVALVPYRIVFGVVKPIPERVLERERTTADS